MPPGPVRLISICAGQGHDVFGVLPDHPRRADVTAVLVELDRRNIEAARTSATRTSLRQVEIIEGDAAISDVYAPAVPADLVLACGVFGNVTDVDLERTVRSLSMLCRPGASIIWTRHRLDTDLTPQIRRWFSESGFEELSFDAPENPGKSGIGTVQLVGAPLAFQPNPVDLNGLDHHYSYSWQIGSINLTNISVTSATLTSSSPLPVLTTASSSSSRRTTVTGTA